MNEKLITHYITIAKLPDLIELKASAISNSKIFEEARAELEMSDKVFGAQWVKYDCLLVSRLENNQPLDTLKEEADKFNMIQSEIEQFIGCYKTLLADTGISDFEPHNSIYLIKQNKEEAGVRRGQKERWAALVHIQKIFESSLNALVSKKASDTNNDAKKIMVFCELWQKTVDAKDPWFIARNKDELELIYSCLKRIGVENDQFELIATSTCDLNLSTIKLESETLKSMKVVDKRISRGSKNIVPAEFGIRVKQKLGSKIGDGRDTHRLMLILAACIQLKL